LERLESVEQALLETASVAGMVFSAATVAAGIEAALLEVEHRCGALARQHQFVQFCGTAAWPDGTLAAQYAFRHAFYQEVFSERVLGVRRAQVHRQVGVRLETGYGPHARDMAAELARHFVQGRDVQRAVQYLRWAGENAVRRSQEALALAQTLAHPASLALAHYWATFLSHRRREVPAVQAHADTLLTLAPAQGFPLWVGLGTCWRGWVLTMQGQSETGLTQLRQGLTAVLATGQTLSQICLILLAEAAAHVGQGEEGLRLLAEALTALEASARGDLLAETYRLQGELLLRQTSPDAVRAEACFQQALALADTAITHADS